MSNNKPFWETGIHPILGYRFENEISRYKTMNYFDEIDPIGEDKEEQECTHCGNPCAGTYCSKSCYNYDNQ
jgi:hypothetical protein